jgi:hypothetical protein
MRAKPIFMEDGIKIVISEEKRGGGAIHFHNGANIK